MERRHQAAAILLIATTLTVIAGIVAQGAGPTPAPSTNGTASTEQYSLIVVVKAPPEIVPGGKPQAYQCLNVRVIVEPGGEGHLVINMTGDTSPSNVERALACLRANLGPAPASWSPQPVPSGTITYYSSPLSTGRGQVSSGKGSSIPPPTPGGESAHAPAGPASSNSSRLAVALGAGLAAGLAVYIVMARW